MSSVYQVFRTRTGRRVWLRTLAGAKDVPYLIDLFSHLSPTSRYLRFNEPLADPDPAAVAAEARAIAENACRQGKGWLAFVRMGRKPQVAVGGVRWVRLDQEEAEIALTVRDDFQGQGIGQAMLRVAAADARAAGILRFVAIVHSANQAVSQLLRHSPVAVRRVIHAGQIYIEADLTDADWGVPPTEMRPVRRAAA